MKGQEILGQTTAELMEILDRDTDESAEIVDVLVVAVIHVDTPDVPGEDNYGASYLHTKCSNASWIFQNGLAHAIVEKLEFNRTMRAIEPDDEDEDGDEL